MLGWRIEKWQGPSDYWLITTGEESEPGIDGGIGRQMEPEADAKTNLVVHIASVDDVAEKVIAADGKVVAPKTAGPGIGWSAYFEDSEGTVFGVMQRDSSAE